MQENKYKKFREAEGNGHKVKKNELIRPWKQHPKVTQGIHQFCEFVAGMSDSPSILGPDTQQVQNCHLEEVMNTPKET